MVPDKLKLFGFFLALCITGSLAAQEMIPYRKGNLWGYADGTGKIVIEPRFERTWFFTGDNVARIRQKGLFGYTDRNGRIVIPPQYSEADDFVMGIANVRKGDRKLCINLQGLPDECNAAAEDDLYEEESGEVFITHEDSTGLVSIVLEMTGDTIPEKFDRVIPVKRYFFPQENQFALVSRDGLWGVYNDQGNLMVPVEFERVDPLDVNSSKVLKDGRWGVLDAAGTMVIPCAYDSIAKFVSVQTDNDGLIRNEYFIVSKNSKSALLDKDGKTLLPMEYDVIEVPGPCNCAIDFVVRKEDRYGIVDGNGKFILPLRYTYAEPFRGANITLVKDASGKEGYVKRDGTELFSN